MIKNLKLNINQKDYPIKTKVRNFEVIINLYFKDYLGIFSELSFIFKTYNKLCFLFNFEIYSQDFYANCIFLCRSSFNT